MIEIKYKSKISKDIEFVSESIFCATILEVFYDRVFVLRGEDIIETRFISKVKSDYRKIVFPGDRVLLNKDNFIEKIVFRKNILCREKYDGTRIDGSGKLKIVACNIDLAVLVVSFSAPPLHSKFIDRYLLLLQNSHIDCILCVNKSDLKTKREEEILDIYRSLGLVVIETSTTTLDGIPALCEVLVGKQSIFVGHSGVGKSSLIRCVTGKDVRVDYVGQKSGKGRHTTTSSKYYLFGKCSSIIDTPGIRSLDIRKFSPVEIKSYFSEFRKYEESCKYKDCMHYLEDERDCGVKSGVREGFIHRDRYESYRKLIAEVKK